MDYKQRPEDPLFRDCVSTALSEDELAFYLRQAWKEIYETDATKSQLCILWCHTSLETGRGKFIYNNNFGNIKRREGQPYTSYKCNEILNGKAQWFEPYHPQTFFQSWDSAVEGAKAYLQFLNKKRYQPALESLKAGNVYKYCAKLKEGGYFTADLNYYTNLMVKLSKSFDKKSELFMSFVPDDYIHVEVVPNSQPPTVKEPSIPPKDSPFTQGNDSATTTLPSTPSDISVPSAAIAPVHKTIQGELDKKTENDKLPTHKNSFFEIIMQIFSLVIQLFKGKK
jgi:hypothetical protein